jgi:sulfur carrier protein ThiS
MTRNSWHTSCGRRGIDRLVIAGGPRHPAPIRVPVAIACRQTVTGSRSRRIPRGLIRRPDDDPGATHGRLRPPSYSLAKLRLTRRAWLLLWLTAALIALVDGGLLLGGASVTVMVEGRSRSLPAGLTAEQALRRLGLPGMAGDLLAVDHRVLRKGVYPPRVLVNGQLAPATRRLDGGDRVTVSRGRTRIEPVDRLTWLLPSSRPGNLMRSLATGPARAVLDRGRLSGRIVPVAFPSTASTAGPLAVALTFDGPRSCKVGVLYAHGRCAWSGSGRRGGRSPGRGRRRPGVRRSHRAMECRPSRLAARRYRQPARPAGAGRGPAGRDRAVA